MKLFPNQQQRDFFFPSSFKLLPFFLFSTPTTSSAKLLNKLSMFLPYLALTSFRIALFCWAYYFTSE